MYDSTYSRLHLSLIAAIAVGAFALPAAADTVAWWHFDEKAPGEAYALTTAIVDSCGNAPNGSPLVSGGTGLSQWNNKPELRPAPVFPFVGKQIFDPVGATTNSNRSALYCSWADKDSIQAYYGGLVRIPGTNPSQPDPTQPTDAITVECFVCTTNTTVPNVFMPIAGKRRGSGQTSETWALYAMANGKLALRIATAAKSDSYILGYNSAPYGIYTVNDGAWHHVAFTYDKDTGVAKVYVDYKLDQTHQLPEGKALVYDTNSSTLNYHAIYIGGYAYSDSGSGRQFNGSIDELRISNAALEPDKFLRLVPSKSDGDDEDTVLHLSFDSDTTLTLADGAVVGGTVGGLQARLYAVSGADASTLDTSATVGDSVAASVWADTANADTASFRQYTNTTGNANYLKVAKAADALFPDGAPSITNLDYTVEAFFKARGSEHQVRRNVLKFGTDYMPAQFVTGDEGHPNRFDVCYRKDVNNWQSIGTPDSVNYHDGNWHHVALVSDASNSLIRAYFDYELMGQATGVYVPVRKNYSLFIGSKENGGGQFFDGWIDDVRVTKRALAPDEFLTTHPVGSATQPLLTAMLERDYEFTCASNSAFSVTGAGSARNGGDAPEFQPVSRGSLLLDGTNGTVSVVNDWSAHMDRSRIVFPASPFYELNAYTVEFWAKFDGYKDAEGEKAADHSFGGNNHVGVLRFVQGDTTTFDWYLFRLANNPSGFQIAVRNANNSIEYKMFLLDRLVADGKWHHYAVQFARNADNTEGSVLMYADYKPLTYQSGVDPAPQSLAGFYDKAASHRLMVCESTSADLNIIGYIDAIRFWKGNPDPSRFLGRAPNAFTIVVR